MIVTDWRPHVRGTLHGFVTVVLDIGLVISGIKVFGGEGGAFVQLPDKPALQDGQLKRDASNNIVYYPAMKWQNRQIGDKFSSAVIRLLREKYLDALTASESSSGGTRARPTAAAPQRNRGRPHV